MSHTTSHVISQQHSRTPTAATNQTTEGRARAVDAYTHNDTLHAARSMHSHDKLYIRQGTESESERMDSSPLEHLQCLPPPTLEARRPDEPVAADGPSVIRIGRHQVGPARREALYLRARLEIEGVTGAERGAGDSAVRRLENEALPSAAPVVPLGHGEGVPPIAVRHVRQRRCHVQMRVRRRVPQACHRHRVAVADRIARPHRHRASVGQEPAARAVRLEPDQLRGVNGCRRSGCAGRAPRPGIGCGLAPRNGQRAPRRRLPLHAGYGGRTPRAEKPPRRHGASARHRGRGRALPRPPTPATLPRCDVLNTISAISAVPSFKVGATNRAATRSIRRRNEAFMRSAGRVYLGTVVGSGCWPCLGRSATARLRKPMPGIPSCGQVEGDPDSVPSGRPDARRRAREGQPPRHARRVNQQRVHQQHITRRARGLHHHRPWRTAGRRGASPSAPRQEVGGIGHATALPVRRNRAGHEEVVYV
eukprot:scaffold7432_cov107-Isochrysis_galbana.AAC.8